MATAVLTALKGDGHVLVERGGEGPVIRELDTLLAPILPRLVARAARAPVSGEVTSTFGDEATDEAVEELVAELREAIIDNDHVEDVFAEDRELERAIFRALRDGLIDAARNDDEADAARVPISVRLDTLGYVAATAARRADEGVVRAALERAARQADGELAEFEPGARVALFSMTSEDPDHRLEVEEAVADELMSLVTEGAVDLPTVDRTIALGRELSADEWRAARVRIDAAAQRLTVATGVPAVWRPDGAGAIRLSFTPLSEKDAELVDEITAVFQRDVTTLIGHSIPEDGPRSVRGVPRPPAEESAPPASRRGPPSRGPDSVAPVSKAPVSKAPVSKAPVSKAPVSKAPAKKVAAKAPGKKVAAKAPAKKVAAKKAGEPKSPAAKKKAATSAPAPPRSKPAASKRGKG